MRRFTALIVCALVAIAAPALRAATSQDIVRFDAPLQSGLTLRYILETERLLDFDAPAFPGGGQRDEWTQRTEVTLLVAESAETGATLRLTVDRLSVELSSSRSGDAWYDTAPAGRQALTAPLERALEEALAGAAGTVCVIEVDAERRITGAAWETPIDARLSREARDLRERALGRERVIELVQPLLRPVGAPGAVAVGDAWDHAAQERSPLGTLAITSTHTYLRDEDALAEFGVTGAVAIDPQGMGGGIDVRRDTLSGTLAWDAGAGVAMRAQSDLDVEYALGVEPPMTIAIRVRERLRRAESVTQGDADDLAPLLAGACARFDQPAIAAAVVSADEVLALGVAGVRVLGSETPAEQTDAFHIGSCTKAMTAALLMSELQRRDGVSLDTTLGELFMIYAQGLHPTYAGATLRDLLGHTAGLPAFTSGAAPENAALRELTDPDNPRLARSQFSQRLLTARGGEAWAPAGERGAFVYSNAGYAIAAHITENLAGRSWEELIEERVFGALGMEHAGFGWPVDPRDPEGQPRGHYGGLGSLRPQPVDDEYELGAVLAPSGDVHASILGWARFAQDRLRALTGGRSELLGAGPTLDLMTPRDGAEYAGGWIVADVPGLGTLHAHDGSAGTFYSSLWILPERDRAVLVVTNAGTGAEACEAVRGRLLQRYIPGDDD